MSVHSWVYSADTRPRAKGMTDLPLEICEKIWGLVAADLPGQTFRMLPIERKCNFGDRSDRYTSCSTRGCWMVQPVSPPHVLSQLCRESRAFLRSQSHEVLGFGLSVGPGNRIWFRPSHDIVYVGPEAVTIMHRAVARCSMLVGLVQLRPQRMAILSKLQSRDEWSLVRAAAKTLHEPLESDLLA